MTKKKRFAKKTVDDEEMAEIRAHNKIIDGKEKTLRVKHQEMWEKKKVKRRGFNER